MPKQIRGWLALALLLATAGVQAGTVLVVGDNLSAGYGVPAHKVWINDLSDLAAAAKPAATVVSAAIRDDTSAGAVSRLPALLRQHRPAVVVIEMGVDDGLRGVPLKATRQNLARMVKLSRQAGAQVLLIELVAPPKLGADYGRQFRALYAQVAKAGGARLMTSFYAGVRSDPDMMQADGVYPNSLAQPLLARNVWKVLAPLLK